MQMIKAELVLWVAGFVLLSLIVNAPMLPWLLKVLRLNIGKLPALAAAPLQCCLWYSCLPVCCNHSFYCSAVTVLDIPTFDQEHLAEFVTLPPGLIVLSAKADLCKRLCYQ